MPALACELVLQTFWPNIGQSEASESHERFPAAGGGPGGPPESFVAVPVAGALLLQPSPAASDSARTARTRAPVAPWLCETTNERLSMDDFLLSRRRLARLGEAPSLAGLA